MYLKHIVRMLYGNGYLFDEEIGGIGDVDDADVMSDDDKTDDKDDNDKDDSDNEDDDKDDDKDEDKDDSKDDDDDEAEDEEEKDDDQEEDEETEDDKEADRVTHVTDIKKAFPDFFKKFPDVKAALYRDQRFSEVFGSPDDAENAAKRSNTLAEIEKDLIAEGDPTELLKVIEGANKDSYEKVLFATMHHVQENNKELYYELAALPLKQVLRRAWSEGKGKESDLGKAAAWIHNWFFGDTKFDEKVKAESGAKPGEKSKEQKEYEDRLTRIESREYNNFKGSVDQSYVRRMDAFIREGLDKDDRLSDYVKGTVVKDILKEIVSQVENDKSYMSKMSSLFKQAKENDWSNDFKSRIVSTALARAKSLVPALRAKLVNQALGKKDKKEKPGEKHDFRSRKQTDNRQPQRHQQREGKKPMSDIDVLRSA